MVVVVESSVKPAREELGPVADLDGHSLLTTFSSGKHHFSPRISDSTGWYLQSGFQFSVGPTVRTYTTNVPTL
jgi:hypothetical protein